MHNMRAQEWHELNCVVAKFLDARQNILGKFFVRPNTSFGGGDSDVSFIDFCACWFGGVAHS